MDQEVTVSEKPSKPEDHGHGPKYYVDIEGTVHPWEKDTITFEEIVALGGWDVSQGVIQIDKDNNETTLQPGQVVELKPGHGFSKKYHWKRASWVCSGSRRRWRC